MLSSSLCRAFPVFFLVGALPPLGAADSAAALAWRQFSRQSQEALSAAQASTSTDGMGAADAAILAFSDFFGPIGNRGLEYSAKLQALAGRKVRLTGYMVREPNRVPGVFLLTSRPTTVEKSGYCFHEDLPTATAHVLVGGDSAQPVPFRPGRIEIVGTLELGPRLEADGRNSSVRLVLDSAAAATLTGRTGEFSAHSAPVPR